MDNPPRVDSAGVVVGRPRVSRQVCCDGLHYPTVRTGGVEGVPSEI